MNTITLTGNVVADPERKTYTKGEEQRSMAVFRMANNERVGDRDILNGFFDVTVFGPQAKNVLDTLRKGDRIVVTARLTQTVFDREDGTKGSAVRLVALAVGYSLEFSAVQPVVTRKAEAPVPEEPEAVEAPASAA